MNEINEQKIIDEKYEKYLKTEEGIIEGNTLEITDDLEKELFKTEWKKEAEQIPLDIVSDVERDYLNKLINQSEVSEEDKEIIGDILAKYRPAIRKIKPAEVMDNLENNQILVEDEKSFLDLVEDFDTIQLIYFTCFIGDKKVKMKFDLYPIEDSRAISDITDNLSLFKDLTQEELVIYNKMENNEPLSREEILIRADLQNKIRKATYDNTRETLIEYLALQLKFHGRDSAPEDMKKVFNKISNAYLSVLFDEVQRRNHISDINADEVFQSFS